MLDFCAAPGTKTTHLGELMGGGGDILAVDVDRGKLNLVEEAARRCGLANVRTHLAEQVGSLEPGSFDRVLVDAPCSNTGVLARRVEARWRFRDDELRRTVVDQGHILALASMFLAPGGRLVYSTCSIEPEEDELLVQAFLRKNGRFRLAEERPTLPSGEVAPERYHDGGYWAALTVR